MPRLVMKFGGTSVADLDRIRNAAAKVKREVERGYDVAVVVSAMAGKTNELVGWVRQTSLLYDAREYDAVVASGENVTAGLMALTLQEMGVPARSWQGWQVPLRTNSSHGAARIEAIETEGLIRKFGEGLHAVIAGFQGISPEGRITTLGRGGSDTSAVAFAAALEAERCDIYTDVDGVYTTDPRITRKARKLERIAYEEMLELASLGAKVLQTRSVELAMRYKVRLQVLSSFSDAPGTIVCDEEEIMESRVVSGVAHSRDEAKMTVIGVPDRPGIAAALFGPLADGGVNVDMIVQNIARRRPHRHDLLLPGRRGAARPRRHREGAGLGRPRLRRPRRRRGRGQGLHRRHRHAQPGRRRPPHVRGAGPRRGQHQGHHHLRDQGLRAHRPQISGTGGAGAP